MAQHDMVIDNGSGAVVRADINSALNAIATNNSGTAAPSVTYPRMWWPDETNGRLKQRNAANTAWVDMGPLDVANMGHLVASNNLNDLASVSAARTNLELGTAATANTGTSAGNVIVLDGSSRLPAVDGSLLTGIGGSDQTARDQIALTNKRLMYSTSISSGALAQGYQWDLSTDEWSSGSTGYAYVSGSIGYYTNRPQTQQSSSGITSGSGFNGVTWINRVTSLPNSATIYQVGLYLSNADSGLVVKIVKRNSAGNYDVVVNQAFAHPGGGMQWATLSSPYNVPASGNYYIAAYQTAATNSFLAGTARAEIAGNLTTNTSSATESTSGWTAVGYVSSSNMVIVSPSVSVSLAPAYMVSTFCWKDDNGSAVIGTDLTAELSRDNGTTWAAATLTTIASLDGTYSTIKARADVSGQPSGTSLKVRISTTTKSQRVALPDLCKE